VAVVNLPFVAPVVLAKQAAAVDVLSEGRLTPGLGRWADRATGCSGGGVRRNSFLIRRFILDDT